MLNCVALRQGEAALPQREPLQLLLAILALLAAGLALPEFDPELDNREEPFFDQTSANSSAGRNGRCGAVPYATAQKIQLYGHRKLCASKRDRDVGRLWCGCRSP